MPLDDLINSMPHVPYRNGTKPKEDISTKVILNLVKQLIVSNANKDIQSKQEIQDVLGVVTDLVADLSQLIKDNDKQIIVDQLTDILASIDKRINSPIVNVETNQDDVVNAIQKLKFPDNKSVYVNNLETLASELRNLSRKLDSLEQTTSEIELISPDQIKVSNLKDMKLEMDEKIIKYLKNLEKLNTTAKNPLAVRLSDGKAYYKAVKDAVSSGVRTGYAFSQPELKYAQITSGVKAMTGTAVQLVSSATSIVYMEVSAIQQPCAVGASNVVCDLSTPSNSRGTIIYPGSNPFKLKISDASKVYADGASGAAVSYNYYK